MSADRRWFDSAIETAEMIKIQHTVFALPFALIAAATAAPGWPRWTVWFWILVAMICARTAAMTFNRLADRDIDSANPRTAGRSLPAGRLSSAFAWGVTALSIAIFLLATAQLNRLTFLLAPVALVVLLGYSYAKRFTAAAHLWLGVALGMAPIAASIAVIGAFSWPPIVLGAAVALWVAGFDVIYSLQDEAFDREAGLHSIPARFGAKRALAIARVAHVAAGAGFIAFALALGGGWLRLAAVAAAIVLMVWQHTLVAPGRLERVDAAFFTANGIISMILGACFLLAKGLG